MDAKKIVVNCPHCGHPSTYTQRISNGSQVDTCRHCHKAVRIEFQGGDLRDVRE